MIRAIIIDDEKSSCDTLSLLLKNYCTEVELVGEAYSAEDGARLLESQRPALVFLDVELPLGSGFDFLESTRASDFDVIFTTAHDDYALRAIKVCALDYLLKPISASDLKTAVAKVISQSGRGSRKQQLGVFTENLSNLNRQLSKIVLPTSDGFVVVEVKNIVRCEADSNYTLFVLAEGKKVLVSKTLKEFDELLKPFDFLRIHQSHLINAGHVQRYIKGSGGYVKMSDDSIIEVSRRKKSELMQRFLSE